MHRSLIRKISLIIIVSLLGVGSPGNVWSGWMEALNAFERKDYSTALKEFKLFEKRDDSKEQSYTAFRFQRRAQYHLGFMYQRGLGVPKDYKEAAKWYRKAADRGDTGAQASLLDFYREGKGVKQDYKEAVKLSRILVKEPNRPRFKFFLGWAYLKGKGVKQDYKEALGWFRKASNKGSVKARYYMGEMYRNGYGVLKDNTFAHMWFRLAAEGGDKNAIVGKRKIEKEMTPLQIKKTKRLAAEWKIETRLRYFGHDPPLVKKFLNDIQSLFKKDNAKEIVKMIRFPQTLALDGGHFIFSTKEEFIEAYPKLFSKIFREAIRKEEFIHLYVKSKNISVGDGNQIWLEGTSYNGNYRSYIIGIINNKPYSGDSSPSYYKTKGRKIIKALNDDGIQKFIALLKLPENESALKQISAGKSIESWGKTWGAFGLFLVDINNDGRREYILTYAMSGSGNYSGVTEVYSVSKNRLRSLDFNNVVVTSLKIGDMSRFHMNLKSPFLFKKQGKVYMNFSSDERTYLWQDQKFQKIEKK
jgi:TPR repeat protein